MKRSIRFHADAFDEYLYWSEHDPKVFRKLNALLKEIRRTPFEGTGSPEPLKHTSQGYWSRRLTHEDRVVYKVTDTEVIIAECRYHYK
jgi:toxin YoeB